MAKERISRATIGWREWIALPELNVKAIKAKIDTGANTSSLHAFEIERFRRAGKEFVRFQIHPLQRSVRRTVQAEVPLLEMRSVRSSNGHLSERPVIETEIAIFDQLWTIELTLANRDQMGFRMLLGREALRGRFLVDVGASYLDSSRVPVRRKS
ncbi:ATP-dependent zinc protease family protein [Planctomicrobium sp. SH661]|uniref:ATP-dependent zinc protease family protein n=1 Tax=Planctomicrobium sp. SH661 TaxID=3448124 RepID=UPI003F5BC1A5